MTSPESEPVGSVSEEAFKLFRALSGEARPGGGDATAHQCTASWCPVCQVVGFVRENPDALTHVAQSAAAFTRSMRDLIDVATAPRDPS